MSTLTPRLAHPPLVRRAQAYALYVLVAAIFLAVHVWRWHLSSVRWFCVDEFEHLHAAWCVGQGQVPYRDFFEHHTPLLYFLLAPVLRLFHAEASYDTALGAILFSRRLMWFLAALVLYLTYRLGRRAHSRPAGALAVIFTMATMMFVDRTTEIRPDMLSVPCILAALLLTPHAHTGTRTATRALTRRLFLAGLLFGLALLATPKTLFSILGYTPAMLAWLLVRRAFSFRRVIVDSATLLAGFFLPLALALAWFAAHGALGHFVHYNFLLNAHWKFRLDPWEQIGALAYENPPLAALGAVGLLRALLSFRRAALAANRHLLPWVLLALIAGIFLIPVPYTEYFLMPIPLLAIFEAGLIVDAVAFVSRSPRRLPAWPAFWLLTATAALAWVLTHYRPPFVPTAGEALAWILALLAAAACAFLRLRHLALAFLIVMLCVFPYRRMKTLFAPTNADQRAALAYVHAHTTPRDPIFDGWKSITAPFRPHAWFYFFLHREIRPMVPQAQWESLAADLAAGRIRPALVVFDEDTAALPPPIPEFFRTRYRPTGTDALWSPR